MEEENFSWANEDDVVVRRVEAIAVYANPEGDVVIRQQDALGNEDPFIVIPASQVKTVIAAMKKAANLK